MKMCFEPRMANIESVIAHTVGLLSAFTRAQIQQSHFSVCLVLDMSHFSVIHGLNFAESRTSQICRTKLIDFFNCVLFENRFAGFIFCKIFCNDLRKIVRISEAPMKVSNLVHKYTMKK